MNKNSNYSPGTVKHFFANLAGYDLNLIPEYAEKDIKHECNKLSLIGISVIIPSIFGLFSAYFYFGAYLKDPYRSILALIVAFLLLIVDCVIVTTLSGGQRFGILIRIVMSICLGIVLSEPAILFLYEKTITANIQQDIEADFSQKEKELNKLLKEYSSKEEEVNNKINELRDQLDNFSDQNIINQRISYLDSQKNEEIERLETYLNKLKKEYKEKKREYDEIKRKMYDEDAGRGITGKAGKGPEYERLKNNLISIESGILKLKDDIEETRDKIHKIRVNENTGIISTSIPTISNKELTEDEKAKKEYLMKQVNELTQNLTNYRSRIGTIQAQINALYNKNSDDLSKRTDTLTKTKTLFKIAFDNPILLINILSLFLLVFFIETLPVLIKLTGKTGYGEYFKSLTYRRKLRSTLESYELIAESVESTKKNIDKLMDYQKFINNEISNRSGNKSELMIEFNRKIDESIIRNTDEILCWLEEAESKSHSISLFKALSRLWSRLKRRISIGTA